MSSDSHDGAKGHLKGWYDQSQSEIGDLCVGQTKKVGAYMVQKAWSIKASSCA
jgi:hypothetical protein